MGDQEEMWRWGIIWVFSLPECLDRDPPEFSGEATDARALDIGAPEMGAPDMGALDASDTPEPDALLSDAAPLDGAPPDGGPADAAPQPDAELPDARPVCTLPSGLTPQALCDVAGNVAEWVEDHYHSNYDGAPLSHEAWREPGRRPEWRATRGGHFGSFPSHVRTRARISQRFDGQYPQAGFRVSRDVD